MVDVGRSHTLDGQSYTAATQGPGGHTPPPLSVLQNDAHHGLQRAVADPLSEVKDLSGFLAEMSQPLTHGTQRGQTRGSVASGSAAPAAAGSAEPTATSLQLRLAELQAAEAPLMQPAGELGAYLHTRQRSWPADAATASKHSKPADVEPSAGQPQIAAAPAVPAAPAAPAVPAPAPAQASASAEAEAPPRKLRKTMPAITVVLKAPGLRSSELTTAAALAPAAPAALAAPASVPRPGRDSSFPYHTELDDRDAQRLKAQKMRKPLVPADTRAGRQGGDTRAAFSSIEARLEAFRTVLPKGRTHGRDEPQPPLLQPPPPQPPPPPQQQQQQPPPPQPPPPQPLQQQGLQEQQQLLDRALQHQQQQQKQQQVLRLRRQLQSQPPPLQPTPPLQPQPQPPQQQPQWSHLWRSEDGPPPLPPHPHPPPRPQPPSEWREVRSWDGRTYYHNQRTNETAWQRPTELGLPPPSATSPPVPHSQRSPPQQLPPQPPQAAVGQAAHLDERLASSSALRGLAYKADLAKRLAAWKAPQRGQSALARRRPRRIFQKRRCLLRA